MLLVMGSDGNDNSAHNNQSTNNVQFGIARTADRKFMFGGAVYKCRVHGLPSSRAQTQDSFGLAEGPHFWGTPDYHDPEILHPHSFPAPQTTMEPHIGPDSKGQCPTQDPLSSFVLVWGRATILFPTSSDPPPPKRSGILKPAEAFSHLTPFT